MVTGGLSSTGARLSKSFSSSLYISINDTFTVYLDDRWSGGDEDEDMWLCLVFDVDKRDETGRNLLLCVAEVKDDTEEVGESGRLFSTT
jgi:hypothetical protein